MGDNFGQTMKVAIPLATTAAVIAMSGGAVDPASAGAMAGAGAGGAGVAGAGLGLAETGGALGLGEGFSLGGGVLEGFGGSPTAWEELGLGQTGALEGIELGSTGSWGTSGLGGANGAGIGTVNAQGLTPIKGGFVAPTFGASPSRFDWDKGLNRGFMGMMGGSILSNAMGLNQPQTPFQMGSAQAPSPVMGTSGRFTPTAQGAADRLVQQMAARKQKVPRFA